MSELISLCFATNNDNKIEEVKALLAENFKILTLKAIGCKEDLAETQASIAGNSLQKAQYIWDKYGINCFADDSGLEIDALNGEPGVLSARYAGEHGNHAKNIDKVLHKLDKIDNRAAQFRTVITLILAGNVHQFEGIIQGNITRDKRGTNGFGYDPIFVPEGYKTTFAEMSMAEKAPISHRGLAIQQLVKYLEC